MKSLQEQYAVVITWDFFTEDQQESMIDDVIHHQYANGEIDREQWVEKDALVSDTYRIPAKIKIKKQFPVYF